MRPDALPNDSREELLRRQMEQFFAVTTDSILFLDRDYNFTFLNAHAKEMLMPAGTDLVGANLYKLFPDALVPGTPFAEAYRLSMEEGLPSDFEAFYGSPVNRRFRIQSYPAAEGMMIIFGDVTRQHDDREALHSKTKVVERQHAELLSIYGTAPIGLALFDLDDYHYLRLNDRQAAFFGLKPEDVVGKTLTEMAPGVEVLRGLFDQVARGEPVINYPLEGTLVTDPSEYRYWNVSYFPVHDADGKVVAITAASQEITQQRKAEQALMQSEKLAVVGRLASSIAHEINNPLEAVTNLLYLARYSDTLEEAQTYIDRAEVELRRVSTITTQTLRFHKQATSPQEIDLNALITETLTVFHGRILNGKVRVEHRLYARRKLRCFDGEVRQVISNLVGNAIDAMPDGGRILLRSRETTNWATTQSGITLTIADSGTGMSTKTLAKLFKPFFTTKGLTGTGLGLWVSHGIVERHGGSLRVFSSQATHRHGTAFTVFLPFNSISRDPEPTLRPN